MKLSDCRDAYYGYSGKASDVTRQLAFAGLALIWTLKLDPPQGVVPTPSLAAQIPGALTLPLGVLAVALFFDLAQYVVATVLWGSFHRQKEQEYQAKNIKNDSHFLAPDWINWPTNMLFAAKVICTGGAYAFILDYLYSLWHAANVP